MPAGDIEGKSLFFTLALPSDLCTPGFGYDVICEKVEGIEPLAISHFLLFS